LKIEKKKAQLDKLKIAYNIKRSGFTEINSPQHLGRAQNKIARLKILIAQGWATKMSERCYL
jgi:glutathione synthase/RimK-type ligase-like ATP-grasp enzyme